MVKRQILKALLTSAIATMAFAGPASAVPLRYSFDLDLGGSGNSGNASGSFVLDVATGALSEVSVSTTAAGFFDAQTYSSGEFGTLDSGFSDIIELTSDPSADPQTFVIQPQPAASSFPGFPTVPGVFLGFIIGEDNSPNVIGEFPGFDAGRNALGALTVESINGVVPLPAAGWLLLGGLGALGLVARRRRQEA